ncbi:sensor histidine kinase, partial [Mycobacterium sp.]|uniref:sensor histidine kinase n=1 Tax=Mycobacterium sp. TaxID=1785 RepID=UPI002D427460
PIEPIPVYTSEEIGQVAHAVDELHEQALLLAGEQAALQHQIADMFETLSRRSRTLVDQQLSLIDRLERNEGDPQRLDSLFRLDHLAARMRRNAANLLVLSGATIRREQAEPMPLAAVINAAASEVEDYRRVTTSTVPDSSLVGTATADVIHLLAELLDNALRYSPPTSPVRVSAVHTGNRGLVIEVSDIGLGMTEGDLRMANTRLKSGGEVTPYAARHMGLFVVGRLAAQHGLVVRLRSSVAGEPGSGTTAGVYLPAELIIRHAVPAHTRPQHIVGEAVTEAPSANGMGYPTEEHGVFHTDHELSGEPYVNGSGPADSSSSLPRRKPGASGIGAIGPQRQEPPRAPTDTSRFFASRAQVAGNGAAGHAHEPDVFEPGAPDAEVGEPVLPSSGKRTPAFAQHPDDDDSPIFKKMVSEWLVDFSALTEPPQSWQSVWDHGWAAAEQADETPVRSRTEQGLPVREPGARLVPGSAEGIDAGRGNGAHSKPDYDEVASTGGFHYGRHELGDPVPLRDPNAVRASISNHFGGVHAGRSHAREANEGTETE